MKKRIFSIITALALCLSMLPGMTLTASAAEGVRYIERSWNENTGKVEAEEKSLNESYTTLSTGVYVEWTSGWYVVTGEVTLNESDPTAITASREVNLILTDGCTLTVNGGIKFAKDDGYNNDGYYTTLNIYGQEKGTGKLVVQNVVNKQAGIGRPRIGGQHLSDDKINIHGGIVTATGGENAAGIGGGLKSSDEGSGEYGLTVNIYGGTVTAQGGGSAAGIGANHYGEGNSSNSGGNINIYGGTVTAQGGYYAAGIGGCNNGGAAGTICIYGGAVTAQGGGTAVGIGGGGNHGDAINVGGSVTISGGAVLAKGGESGGIGMGRCDDVTISGGTVTAVGYNGSPGIGETEVSIAPADTTNGIQVLAGAGIQNAANISGSPFYDTTDITGSVSKSFFRSGVAGDYFVSFNANGGAGTIPTDSAKGEYTLPACGFTPPADTLCFKGWALSDNGEVLSGSTYTVNENTTLYAIWGAHEYADATCTNPATCACGVTDGEPLPHTWTGYYESKSNDGTSQSIVATCQNGCTETLSVGLPILRSYLNGVTPAWLSAASIGGVTVPESANQYQKIETDGSTGEATSALPEHPAPGTYRASITIKPEGDESSYTAYVEFTVFQASALQFTHELTVLNNRAKTYEVDLTQFAPTAPLVWGNELSYTLGDLTGLGDYYTSGAEIRDGKLYLPINQVDSQETTSIGTVPITVKSQNYEDSTITLTVNRTNKTDVSGSIILSVADITYGADPAPSYALSSAVSGGIWTLAYSKDNGASWHTLDALRNSDGKLPAGTYMVEAHYEDNTFQDGKTTAVFTVSKADPSYTLPTGLTAAYGDTLTAVELPDGWEWKYPVTSVGDAGSNTFPAIFTPTDTANYNVVEKDLSVEVGKATINEVSFTVTDPVVGEVPQSTVADGTGYTAAIAWNTNEEAFGFNTAYTATVILTADSNHKFAENITVEGWSVQHSESKLTLTKTFEATRKAKLTELTDAPANVELEAYHTNAAGAIAELPTTVAYATERGPVTVAIEWSCADYNSATKATNTFAWSVKAGELDNYDANSIAANGSITVTNVAALPVNNSGADKEITYNGETYNVSEMFSIDENAGAAIYTITGGDGAGALDGSVLTITKAGTITIKLTTAANDPYAAGEATATLTVNKAAGTGTVTMEGWTYGDEAKAPVASDAKGEATFTYNTNDGKVPTNAGTYTVTATFAATDLYEEATATATFTIAKKSIIVKAVAVSKTYGEADPELTYTATGLVGEDKLSGKLNRAEGEDVGTYAIEQGTLTAGNNYAVTYTGANLTINAKAVTITGATIEDVLFAEGGYALNVTGVTFEGVIDGDTLDYTATATLTGENKVGVAAATVTVTLNNGNYSLATATYEAKVNIVEHTHVWSFTASGDTITATCSGTIGTCPVTGKTVTITLSAPTNLTYDGKEKTVTVTQSPADVLENVPAEIKGGCINAGTHTAELTYGGVTATLMFTINGIAQDAPAAPELDSKTYNSVTLKAIATNENGAAAEYSKDGGATWQASPNFTDLSASTKYSFAARYGATGNFSVSPSSAVTEITTDSAPSGGGYVPDSYTITTEDAVNGTVKADRTHASSGTTVTLTVAPDKGYTLESLTVTDKNGKEIELTNKSDGKYTFEMPGSEVTVKATFMDDNTMLSFFVDVPADAYYYDAVLWAAKEGITNGTSATTFSPDNPCTRAQMATFLWRAAGAPEPVGAPHTFTDVPADAYYAKAVQWAYEKGITCGTSATTYSSDEACTRGQMVTFLCRMADGKPVSENGIFSDISADKYYAKAVQWAYEQKITSGTSATTFSPDDPCTRAQMVTFLYRYFVK